MNAEVEAFGYPQTTPAAIDPIRVLAPRSTAQDLKKVLPKRKTSPPFSIMSQRTATEDEKVWCEKMVDLLKQKPSTLALFANDGGLHPVCASFLAQLEEEIDAKNLVPLRDAPASLGTVELATIGLPSHLRDELNRTRKSNARLIAAGRIILAAQELRQMLAAQRFVRGAIWEAEHPDEPMPPDASVDMDPRDWT